MQADLLRLRQLASNADLKDAREHKDYDATSEPDNAKVMPLKNLEARLSALTCEESGKYRPTPNKH